VVRGRLQPAGQLVALGQAALARAVTVTPKKRRWLHSTRYERFLVAEGDQAIPPDAECQFAWRMAATTVEVTSNHVAMVSHRDGQVEGE
jgi:hypothetical protein